MEKWLDENEKPEDKALGQYQEYRASLMEKSNLPLDWDVIDREMNDYLGKFAPTIQAYIIANMNSWVNDLPLAAKQVEQERTKGIEDESWWDNYRGKTFSFSQGLRKIEIPRFTNREYSGAGSSRYPRLK